MILCISFMLWFCQPKGTLWYFVHFLAHSVTLDVVLYSLLRFGIVVHFLRHFHGCFEYSVLDLVGSCDSLNTS